MIRISIIILMLLSFMGFRSCDREYIKVPLFEDCILVTSSILCIDKRLSNIKIDQIIDGIQSMDSIPAIQKEELILYFDNNRRLIIRNKEFRISLDHIIYFRGYFLTNPIDRLTLQQFMDKNLQELEKYKRKCGDLRDGRMVCNN